MDEYDCNYRNQRRHPTYKHYHILPYYSYIIANLLLESNHIHEKLGTTFWQLQIDKIIAAFHAADHTRGICASIQEIGTALQAHFPYEGDKDKNELSDQVVFGR